MSDAAKLLASLERRILTQLAREYNDPDDAAYVYQTMTVPKMLDMLSYMLDGDDD